MHDFGFNDFAPGELAARARHRGVFLDSMAPARTAALGRRQHCSEPGAPISVLGIQPTLAKSRGKRGALAPAGRLAFA